MQRKYRLGGITMADKQIQEAGDNSQLLQVNNMTVNFTNNDEKRMHEIYQELLLLIINNYAGEAQIKLNERITRFETAFIPKMKEVEGVLEAFADPSFQLLLVEAQKTAASTERPADYELLSELLIHRFKNGENRITRAGISRAVEIVDEISDDALLGLTVCHAMSSFFPKSGNIYQGLNSLNDLFGKIIYGKLPTNNDWLDHLDILDAVRINSFGSLKKVQQYYPEMLTGYVDVGIEKKSENYNRAIELLKSAGLPQNILVNHALNIDFVRLEVLSEEQINSLTLQTIVFQYGQAFPITIPFSDIQTNVIKSIYGLYKKDDNIKQQNIKVFMDEWDNRPNLKTLREWWDNIPTSFQTTSVGRVLAHSNAQRCDKSLPPLN